VTVVDELGRSRHVSLTTFRRNGAAVATAVWHVRSGDELIIISDAAAGKIKRIRNNARVLVTACDMRGRIAPGAPTAEGTARLLDEAETEAGRRLLRGRYVTSRLGNWAARLLRLNRPPVIGIAVTFASPN
jgi:PPOX class probable F420-dependent enzyme